LAVDTFFVLSGFVIEHAYGCELRSGMSFRRFAVIRLIRLYPLYIIGLMIGIVLSGVMLASKSSYSVPVSTLMILIAAGLFYVPTSIKPDAYPLNVPSWSLFYELVVNAAYAVLVRWLSNRILYVVAGMSFVGFAAFASNTGNTQVGPDLHDWAAASLRTVFSFTMGVLIYRHQRATWINPAVIIAVVAASILLPVSVEWRTAYDLICVAILFPISIWLIAGRESERLTPVFRALGRISYAAYAIHYPMIWLVRGIADRLALPMAITGLAFIIALVGGCYALDRLYDMPVNRWLKRHILAR